MGNLHSEIDLRELMARQDYVSGTYDVIMTYVISHFAATHVVSDISQQSHEKFMKDSLRMAQTAMMSLQDGKLPGLLQLNTGSKAEGLNLPQLFYVSEDGAILTEMSDDDMLMIDDISVDNTLEKCLENNGEFYLDTSQTYPGFTRVRARDLKGFHKEFLVKREANGEEVHYMSKHMIHRLRGDKSISGPAVTKDYTVDIEIEGISHPVFVQGESSADMVYAVNVTQWPKFMKDWKARQTGISSLGNILEKTGFGCFLVGAAHRHSSDPDIEWRISCSVPELILAHELSVAHRQAYMTFKYLVKETCKGQKGIMTYHLKTTLFWTREKTPSDVWHAGNLAQCLYLLLDNFISFLAQRKLPNYFIPDSNLFEHLSNAHIGTTLSAMMKLRADPLGHLLKFQRRVRLQGHSAWWDHAFSVVLAPHLQTASKILMDQTNYPKSSIILLRQLLFDSVVDLAAAKVSEAGFEDTFKMMVTYLDLPTVIRCGTATDLPLEEHVYNLLVHICQRSFMQTANLDITFSFLRYAKQQLETKGAMTVLMIQRLSLLDACWNQILARRTDDTEMGEKCWDQSAVVFSSFNLEQDGIIVIAEHSCFFLELWARRFRKEADHSQIMEAAKSIEVLRTLLLPLAVNMSKAEFQFFGMWKLLSFEIDHLEPNLTAFLESSKSCYIPYEIIALCVHLMAIRKVLIPSVESFIMLNKMECCCEKVNQGCDHAKRISIFQEFMETIYTLVRNAENLLYNLVAIFNTMIMNLDFNVPADRLMSRAGVNFFLALCMMYARHWEGAFCVLSSIRFQSLPVISSYCNMCALLAVYANYNALPLRKAMTPMTGQGSKLSHWFCDFVMINRPHSHSLQTERHFPKPLYNSHVDMSTYGQHNSLQENLTVRVKSPATDMEMEICGDEITIHDNGTSTTYKFDKDLTEIIQQHLTNRKQQSN